MAVPIEEVRADHTTTSASGEALLEAGDDGRGAANDNHVASSSSAHCGADSEGREGQDNMEGHVALPEGEPYVVPEAWRRVLTAWHEDIAVGITLLPDTGLSGGTFEHQAMEHDQGGTETAGHPMAMAAMEADEADGDQGAAGSTTEGSEGAASRRTLGQTDLRGWLRP